MTLSPYHLAQSAFADLKAAIRQVLADGPPEGLRNSQIGRQLGISARTVQVHLDHLYRKLGVRDRLMAVHEAREQGLLRTLPRPLPRPRTGTHDDNTAPAAALPGQHLSCPVQIPVAGQRAVAWRPGVGALQPNGHV